MIYAKEAYSLTSKNKQTNSAKELFDKTTNKPINYAAKQYIEDIIINLDNFLYDFSLVVPKDKKIFL